MRMFKGGFRYMLGILLAGFLYSGSFAQEVIEVCIKNLHNKPLENISVTVQRLADQVILDYGFSDARGCYTFTLNAQTDSLLVVISGFNIGMHEKKVRNQSQRVDFTVKEEAVKIKDVIVRAPKIYGNQDTVNYSVGAFSDKNDDVIEDVLKKLPGITVSAEGEIKYQGKTINKFYIENMDLLQGRYSLATRNISAKDISTVQVYENHQPIKALGNISPSERAAINLKLKEGIKGVFVITARLGLGIAPDLKKQPVLWNNTLLGMLFTRKMQQMSIYKGNNSGYDVYQELESHSTDVYFDSDEMLRVTMPAPPSIKQNRYLFNNAHAIAFNNLIRSKKGNDWTTNLIYLNDHINRKSRSRSVYFFSDQPSTVIDENISSAQNINRLETDIRFEKNKLHEYMSNGFHLHKEWVTHLGNINNGEPVVQRVKVPSIEISDVFRLVKTKEERGYDARMSMGFKRTPQNLMIYDGIYPDLLNEGKEYQAVKQNVTMTSAFARADFSFLTLFSVAGIKVDPKMKVNVEYSSLESGISVFDNDHFSTAVDKGEMENHLHWHKYTLWAGIGLRYDYGRLSIGADLPLSYNGIFIDNRQTDHRNGHQLFWFEPAVNLTYKISPSLNFGASYQLNNSTANVKSVYTGYILQDYRTIQGYDGLLPKTRQNYAVASLEYKNLVGMLFGNLVFSYFESKNNMITDQYFEDILSITSRIPMQNTNKGKNAKLHLSKGFDFAKTLIGFEISYHSFSSQLLRQNVLADFDNELLVLNADFHMKPFSFFSFKYGCNWGRNYSKISGGETFKPINSLVNTVVLDFSLFQKLNVNLGFETYYNSAAIGRKNISFGDIGLNYKVKNVHISLMCQNVFNTDRFVSSYYNSINKYQYSYDIRPASVMLSVKFRVK